MTMIELDKLMAIFTDPTSEEAKFQNLILNMLGGLRHENCSDEEKALLRKNGYF